MFVGTTPLDFEHYPISHSLLAVTGWLMAFSAAYQLPDSGSTCGPREPPPSVVALAWVGQVEWLLVGWGYLAEGRRVRRSDP